MAEMAIAGAEMALAGAIAWWRDAGVDHAYADEPTIWLAEPEPEKTAAAPPVAPPRPAAPAARPVARIGGDRESWPQDLAAFHAWWLSEPSLDHGRTSDRVAPRGTAEARLMVLVEQPEAADSEVLLSGPDGTLLSAMLAAMGIAPGQAYIAAALPRHMPMPDMAALTAAGLGDVLTHHVALAAPQRILAFGSSILPLLGNHLTQCAQNLHELNHEGRTIPVLGSRPLDALVRGRAKATLWQQWLDWTGV